MHIQVMIEPFPTSSLVIMIAFINKVLISTVAGVSLQNFPVGTAAFLGTAKVLFTVLHI
jgi:hypothetical protein